MKRAYLLVVAILTVVLAGGTGAMIGASSSGATSTAVYLSTTPHSTLLSANGFPVTIRNLRIPAGTWIVTAKVNPVNFGKADYVRCRIIVNRRQMDAGTTLVGDAGPAPTGELGPSVATIALQTAVTTNATRYFSLTCGHDFAYPGEYIDPWASLMVVAAPGPIG